MDGRLRCKIQRGGLRTNVTASRINLSGNGCIFSIVTEDLHIISERMKYLSYNRIHSKVFFWRTTTGKELDWLLFRFNLGIFLVFQMSNSMRKSQNINNCFG